ncbi:MAG: hypothetical protein PHY02_06555 [Phycisphaerae bacterium]|nr:hypothetical protein [Phycisphaerae bacterium]
MRINVPKFAQAHFWDEPPAGVVEFWAFRYKPPCEKGDLLEFYFGGTKVAEATVAMVEARGFSQCEHSGKYKNSWKVFWLQESFKDLREGNESFDAPKI